MDGGHGCGATRPSRHAHTTSDVSMFKMQSQLPYNTFALTFSHSPSLCIRDTHALITKHKHNTFISAAGRTEVNKRAKGLWGASS